MNFIKKYKEIIDATNSTALYKDTFKQFEKSLENMDATSIEIAQVRANFLAEITNNTIQNAMQTALAVVEKELKIDKEIDLLDKQIKTAGLSSVLGG